MIKILAVGNSFSQDATKYLQKICHSANLEVMVRNCYIGGCSLEMHASNINDDTKLYEYQEDAEKLYYVSLDEALKKEKWDFITVQQASHFSGLIEHYEPHLTVVLKHIKKICSDSEIVFHRTWSYEIDSSHPAFQNYNSSQEQMYNCIMEVTDKITKKHKLPIIPVGETIQKFRNIKPFDFKNGGISLNRDGFHLSLDYGRYIAGLVWYKFFTDSYLKEVKYSPENTDPDTIELIKNNI